ncbi:MAG TPA: HAD-IIIC family phosphatase [Bryobacteraceae bacterium]|jgi:FkbH-like protein
MTLNQALTIINSRRESGEGGIYYLACGFEPLHLTTLLRAHLLESRVDRKNLDIQHGVYGDLRGNIDSAARSGAIAAAVVLEWGDIDPRLGLRASGGWSSETKADILASCPQRYAHLESAIEKLGERMPVAVAPPSLPLPPIGNTIRAQSSVLELELEQQLAAFLLRLARLPGVRVVQRQRAEALDVRMELMAGFPYPVPFADALANSLVKVLCQTPPKKGLITDLDDTLWSGLVGEVGVKGVSWSQEHHTQAHGLYQQMLGHLASCGVLLGVCSKNELSIVEEALARKDLYLSAESLFPVHANWGTKSAAIGRILKTWNIAADSVVFVDDNPMELEEVRVAHPGITCLLFPKKDPTAVWGLLGELRDCFGKPVLMDEDRLRQASIRASAQIQEMADDAASPEFLRTLQGKVTLDWSADPADKRALELINKTNQFNLNGLRIEEAEWRRHLDDESTVLAVASYEDKFGPLGKVAVLLGSQRAGKVTVSHWVMSCRAFSRRLEHHTLDGLFQQADAGEVEFAFAATDRNQPLQEFFESLGISAGADGSHRISRAGFEEQCGVLPHQVSSLTNKLTSK